MSNESVKHSHEQHHRLSEEWNRAADGWRKWETAFSGATWPLTQNMLLGLAPQSGERVLDIGCGSGDPALSFSAAVGPAGQVLAIDLASDMIETARQRAKILEQNNITIRQAALEELDEADGSFDVVTARWSIIFFPDMHKSLIAIKRLLRPGGRFAAAGWAPLNKNPMFAVCATVMREMTNANPPPPNEPGPHRLSGDGELEAALTSAGFAIDVIDDLPFYNFAPSVDGYLQMMLDMSPNLGQQLDTLSPDSRATAIERIKSNISGYVSGGVVRVPAMARVAIAHKPA